MNDPKENILSDAIEAYIEAEIKIVKLQKVCIGLSLMLLALLILLVYVI